MPFITACTYCQGKIRVPDRALGVSLTCPRCANAFTIVPFDEHSATVAVVAAPLELPKLPPPPVVVESAEPKKGWQVDRVALASCLCGSVGLLLAGSSSLHGAALGLAGLGLLIGSFGLLIVPDERGRGQLWRGAGSVLSAAVLVLGVFWPGLLHNVWPTSAAQQHDEAGLTSISFGKGGTQADAAEWVDASSRAAMQGDVRVRIVSVGVGPVRLTDGRGARLTRENYVHVVVRVYNAGTERVLSYRTWNDGAPNLRNQNDKPLALARFDAGSEIAGRTRGGDLRPGRNLTDLLLFEVPATELRSLRLELPADHAGGRGVLRFTIPRTMIAGL